MAGQGRIAALKKCAALGIAFVVGSLTMRALTDASALVAVLALSAEGLAIMGAAFYSLRRESGERQAIDEDLEATRARLRLAAEASDAGLWEWQIAAGVTEVSDRFRAILGYEPEELPNSPSMLSDLVHPDDKKGAFEALQAHLAGETEAYEHERRMMGADGSYRWIRSRGRVTERTTDGEAIHLIGTIVDITEAHEAALRLEMALEAAGAGTFDWDLPKDLCRTSETFHHVLGIAEGPECVDSLWLLERLHRVDRERLQSGLKDLSQRAVGLDLELRMRREDGSHEWVQLTGKVVQFSDSGVPHRMLGCLRSVHRARMALQGAEAASRAKSDFLANTSHEVRTPMTAIVGHCELLRDDATVRDCPATRDKAIGSILEHSRALLTLLDEVLDLSALEQGEMRLSVAHEDTASVLESVRRKAQPGAERKGLRLLMQRDPALPEVLRTDRRRVVQVLDNLVGNAIKFTVRGEVKIAVRYRAAARLMEVTVSDTGIGIAPEALESLLTCETFGQADESMARHHGGLGLGFKLAQSLTPLLGGELQVRSLLGVGTEVTVSFRTDLPLMELRSSAQAPRMALAQGELIGRAPQPTHGQGHEEPLAGEHPLAGVRILLVEDGKVNQRLISHHLKKAGATVELADNGRLGVQAIENCRGEDCPQIVLMDMQMPELDGYATTRHLRRAGWFLPIIAVTAHATQGDRLRCLEAGCDEYLTKPVDARLLVATCAAWHRQSWRAIGAD